MIAASAAMPPLSQSGNLVPFGEGYLEAASFVDDPPQAIRYDATAVNNQPGIADIRDGNRTSRWRGCGEMARRRNRYRSRTTNPVVLPCGRSVPQHRKGTAGHRR
jgi:hypothetical protein